MQGSLRPIQLPEGSLALVSLSRTVDFIEPGVPRPPDLPPPDNAPALFTQQSRDEVTEFRLNAAPALVNYLQRALPIDSMVNPKERATALTALSFDTLRRDGPPELLFEALRNLLILSTEAALSLTSEQTLLLTTHAKRDDHNYNIRHLSLLVAFKGPAKHVESELSAIARQPTDVRLRALAAGELARRTNPAHIPIFMELVRSGDPYLVRASTLGLAKLDHAPAVAVFQDILKESNLKMTRAVIRALGMMTHESSRDLLRQLAKNPSNPIVQKEAKRELIRRRIPQ
jgi:HEAT repeat protein